MKLSNEELDAILEEGMLELAEDYAPSGSYRKDRYLFTRCKQCGTEAHYRLRYILDKNAIGEKVCRTCFWIGWYDERRVIFNKSIQNLLDQGEDLDDLIDQGVVTARHSLEIKAAQKLAHDNGFDLVEIRQGNREGDDVLVVRCKNCGRQTAERPGDVAFGCTCRK